MSAVKVTRYSSLIKLLMCKICANCPFFQTPIFPFAFMKEKGLRHKLSRAGNRGYMVKLLSNHKEPLSTKNLKNIGNFEGWGLPQGA